MDAVASTIGNMVVSQVQAQSVGKTGRTPNDSGSMSSLYGVGGSYDDLVRQTTLQSYAPTAGDQFAGMANWNLALPATAVAGGAAGYAGGTISPYGGTAFNVEQTRMQRIADMQLEAANPAIVHAAPALGELNILVTGVASDSAVASFVPNAGTAAGTVNAVGAWLDTPIGWLQGVSQTALKGNAIMAEGLDAVGLHGLASAQMGLGQITSSAVPTRPWEIALDAVMARGQMGPLARGGAEMFGPQIDGMLGRAVPGLRMYAAPEGAAGVAADGTSTVYRVQGGVVPNASKTLITLDAAGNPVIQNGTLNISIGDASHAQYFQSLRPGSTVTSFEIPSWLDSFIRESAIPQYGYRNNPLNQGGLAPKIVDPTTPGRSYELPSPWAQWLQENAIQNSGKVK